MDYLAKYIFLKLIRLSDNTEYKERKNLYFNRLILDKSYIWKMSLFIVWKIFKLMINKS